MLRRIKKFLCVGVLLLSVVVVHGTVRVCVTTSLIRDLVEQVATEEFEIYAIMGAGVDPHLYKATASDMRELSRADIVFYNGLHLEGRMVDILESLKKRGVQVHAISDGLNQNEIIRVSKEEADPHYWFDPMLWKQGMEYVGEILVKAAPIQEKGIKENLARGFKELEKLKEWGLAKADELEAGQRILVTSHDAYNYFGRAFGFRVVGVQGISTASEAGLADVVNMVDFIKEKKIKSIFVESSVPQATINRISEDAKVAIGGELYSDALGAKGQIESRHDVGTYIGMFKYNMETIVGGLK